MGFLPGVPALVCVCLLPFSVPGCPGRVGLVLAASVAWLAWCSWPGVSGWSLSGVGVVVSPFPVFRRCRSKVLALLQAPT